MRELTVAEQRYHAVMAVISDGLSISQVAEKVGVSRQTLHSWLARYEAEGLEGLVDPVASAAELSASDATGRGGGGVGVAPPRLQVDS
jgi:transposase